MEDLQSPESPGSSQNKINIINLSVISGLAWVGIGALLIYFFHDETFSENLIKGWAFSAQLLIGTLAGLAFGGAGILMMKQPQLRAAVDQYAIMKQVKELSLSHSQIIVVSLIAGITEEVLFRAAIQPLLGIWVTSLLFIAIHGYVKFGSIPQAIFTLFTFLLSMMLGLLYMHFGVVSAMAAHAVYDYVVLYKISTEDRE